MNRLHVPPRETGNAARTRRSRTLTGPARLLSSYAIAAICFLGPVHAVTAQEPIRLACGSEIHSTEASGFVWFPQDETFCPRLADPKQPRSFIAYQRGEFGTLDDPDVDATSIGAIGLADAFGLMRWGGAKPGDGFLLEVEGAVFAQFGLERVLTLINADYIVGIPLTWRRSGFSTRVRVYHQSSHLGDEYILFRDNVERENLSFESVEALLSAEIGPLRLFGGGEHLFRREPDSVDRVVAHAGIELRTHPAGPVSLLAGADAKFSEQQDWDPGLSVRAGIQIAPAARSGHPVRRVLLLAEFYDGPSPYGQFFLDQIRYAGIGVHLLH
jgi:hypothetical protein